MRSIKAYIARRLAANRATTEAPLPRRKRARAPDAGHKATVMPAVDTGVALPTVTAGSVPVRWRKLLLRRRQEITLISQSFEKLWNEHFPRHDFVTLQLKHPAQNKAELYWQNESRKKAARAYHTERKLNGSQPDSKTTELRRLLSNDISLDAAYRQLNASENRPTPQVSIEAIMVGVRERGLKALEERANIERLSRCDESARAQINSRIARISEQKQCQR